MYEEVRAARIIHASLVLASGVMCHPKLRPRPQNYFGFKQTLPCLSYLLSSLPLDQEMDTTDRG